MTRARTVDSIIKDVPTHHGVKDAIAMTASTVLTVELAEGHFTALIHTRPDMTKAIIDIMDHDEVEAMIFLMRNSVEDAKLLDAGKAPIHSTPSLVRN